MKEEQKSKSNMTPLLVALGIILLLYITVQVMAFGSTNELIVKTINVDELEQRAYIVEEDLTYLGTGLIGSFPIFTYFVGLTSYNGTTVTQFTNFDSNYYVTITSGALANNTYGVWRWRAEANYFGLIINSSLYPLLENQTFNLFIAQNNEPIRGFVSIYDNIYLGSNDLNIAFGFSPSSYQPLLYWDKSGTFIAGRLDNVYTAGTIGVGAVGLGYTVPSGVNSVAINGRTSIDAVSGVAIGGRVFAPYSSAIGVLATTSASNSFTSGRGVIDAGSDNSVVIGQSRLYSNSSGSIIIGSTSYIGTPSTTSDAVSSNTIIGNCGQIQDHTENAFLFSNCILGGAFSPNNLNINDSIAFMMSRSGLGSKQMGIFDINKGLLVGAFTGNTMAMTGDDLYVKDNAQIGGALVVGSNTELGLSDGDINASTIYYDVLVAKSPIMMCSIESLKCFVMDVEAEKEYYVTIDANYNIIDAKDKGDKKAGDVEKSVKDKLTKLKLKKDEEDARNIIINTCESLNGTYSIDGCYKTSVQVATYDQAVQKIETPIYSYKEMAITTLNESMHEVIEITNVQDAIISYETEYIFMSGCGWSEDQGYYCVVTEKLNI